jgi:AAA+ superfamily predicted ATPase
MAENNIFTTIAQGVGNANQNIVDTYKLIEQLAVSVTTLTDNVATLSASIDTLSGDVGKILSALFPTDDTAEPTSNGTANSDK